MAEAALDRWAAWILERRFGGDTQQAERALQELGRVRERVLGGADIKEGDVVLDVGAGDGLIAFGALPLVAESGKVILADVSQDLLDVSRGLASELDEGDRCEFVLARAEDLTPLADESVDVVTTRSVVIYVKEKQRAFDEFHRVLKPGGHLSIFEPINSFSSPEPEGRFCGFDVGPVAELAEKVKSAERRIADDATLVDFDERNLMTFAERAGFRIVELAYEARVEHDARPRWLADVSWDTFLRIAPNPLAPTFGELVDRALTPEEAERFFGHLRPLYEGGKGTSRNAVAYLRAEKSLT
jgi:ubiquinone/menaquinone biosynthesis C-methylase UbiE